MGDTQAPPFKPCRTPVQWMWIWAAWGSGTPVCVTLLWRHLFLPWKSLAWETERCHLLSWYLDFSGTATLPDQLLKHLPCGKYHRREWMENITQTQVSILKAGAERGRGRERMLVAGSLGALNGFDRWSEGSWVHPMINSVGPLVPHVCPYSLNCRKQLGGLVTSFYFLMYPHSIILIFVSYYLWASGLWENEMPMGHKQLESLGQHR